MSALQLIASSVAYILSGDGPHARMNPECLHIEFRPCWVRYDEDESLTYAGPSDVWVCAA